MGFAMALILVQARGRRKMGGRFRRRRVVRALLFPHPTDSGSEVCMNIIARILVALDGSTAAREILPYVREIHGVVGLREVILFRAEDDPARRIEAAHELEAEAARLAAAGVAAQVSVHAGSPAEAILSEARARNVDLIAMTTHGRTGIRRVLFGSVAEDVLRLSPVPVLLLRVVGEGAEVAAGGTTRRPLFDHVLVPYDGSPEGMKVLVLVRAILHDYAGSATVLRVLPGGRPLELTEIEEASADAARFARRLDRVGERVTTVLDSGAPAASILDKVEREAASLVVLGTHGRTGIDRLLDGSVTEDVLRHARVPLLVVR
jgi:nucleotide-binding universal stress UspA family protein